MSMMMIVSQGRASAGKWELEAEIGIGADGSCSLGREGTWGGGFRPPSTRDQEGEEQRLNFH